MLFSILQTSSSTIKLVCNDLHKLFPWVDGCNDLHKLFPWVDGRGPTPHKRGKLWIPGLFGAQHMQR